MKNNVHNILRERLLQRAGLTETPKKTCILARFKTEWSPRFEQLMRNRLVMGSLRYETFADKRTGKRRYNYAHEITRRLEAYYKTKNTEFLVDVANLALLEFEFPFLKGAFFNNENDHNIHAKRIK